MKTLALIFSLALAVTARAQTFTATLTGAAERPNPVTTSAFGNGTFTLSGTTLSYSITYSGLSGNPTGSHIHGPGTVDQAVGVMIPFTVTGLGPSGTISGTATVTQTQIDAMVAGLTYANIHTAANGGGEIRGQLTQVPEPSTIALFGLGSIALIAKARRRA